MINLFPLCVEVPDLCIVPDDGAGDGAVEIAGRLDALHGAALRPQAHLLGLPRQLREHHVTQAVGRVPGVVRHV